MFSLLTRRECLAALAAAAARTPDVDGDRLYTDVRHYAGFGDHRTATFADRDTGVWLAAELKKSGIAARRIPFELTQFFVHEQSLTVAAEKLESFPLWYPADTGGKPVTGVIGRDVSVVEFPLSGGAMTDKSGHREIIQQAAKPPVKAIIGFTRHPSGDIFALNAQRGFETWPVPVMLVGAKDAGKLKPGRPVSLLIHGRLGKEAVAHEVVGRYGNSGPMIVVSTPYSGWFRCSGERGPGVALWLHTARRVAAAKPKARYIFVASSAHELDGVGLRTFLKTEAPKPDEVACWMHLGAGIATYHWKSASEPTRQPYTGVRLMTNQPRILTSLNAAFRDVEFLKPQLADAQSSVGELVFIFEQGYPAFGLAGGHFLHHVPQDNPEQTTGPELLAQVARSIDRTLIAIESARSTAGG